MSEEIKNNELKENQLSDEEMNNVAGGTAIYSLGFDDEAGIGGGKRCIGGSEREI